LERVLIVLCSLALTAPAEAQRARPDAEYQRLVREAVVEFDAGRFAEARALFQRAHDLSPNARTLRGIGMAAFEMRAYADAYRALQGALDDTERPLTRRQRRDVEDLLERTSSFLGRYRFETDPADAEVEVDLRPLRRESDGATLLDVGEHSLTATAEGHLPISQRFTVEGYEVRTIVLRLPPAEATTAPDPTDTETATEDEGSASGPPWPIVLAASAGAFLGAAAFGVGWTVERGDEVALCESRLADCVNHDTLTGQRDAAIAFTVASAVTAIAAGAVGLVLLFAAESADDETTSSPSVTAGCGPLDGGAMCTAVLR
jgi:tetratricopeptide (TPR) repeat protein